jgi:hypothetical protein
MYSRSFKDNAAWNNLWRHIPTIFAYNTITPLVYENVIAGSEFVTYAATKLYVAEEFVATRVGVPNVDLGYVTLYDVANAVCFSFDETALAWDTTAAGFKYSALGIIHKNLFFSRIATNLYVYIKFIGYRLTIV